MTKRLQKNDFPKKEPVATGPFKQHSATHPATHQELLNYATKVRQSDPPRRSTTKTLAR